MRKFSSYGPIDTVVHYYAPRTALIDFACQQLLGDRPESGGHYITVWAPRQTGKTWIMQQVREHLKESGDYEVAILTLQSVKSIKTEKGVLRLLVNNLARWFGRKLPMIQEWAEMFGRHAPFVVLFADLSDTVSPQHLHLPNLLRRYEQYTIHICEELNKIQCVSSPITSTAGAQPMGNQILTAFSG